MNLFSDLEREGDHVCTDPEMHQQPSRLYSKIHWNFLTMFTLTNNQAWLWHTVKAASKRNDIKKSGSVLTIHSTINKVALVQTLPWLKLKS